MKEKEKFVAAYKLIKEDIVSDILSGVYEKGGKIQGQNYYANKFQVSRTTVRNAMEELVERGVLETIQGKGTYAKGVEEDFMQGTTEHTEISNVRLKPSSTFHVVKIAMEQADNRIARQLRISPGDQVVRLERVRMLDQFAGNYLISFINSRLVGLEHFRTEELEKKGSLYHMLAHEAHLQPKYSDEMIRAVACPGHIAKYFYIDRNEPILLISRVTYSMEDVAMEYCLDYECTDVNGLRIRDEKGWLNIGGGEG